MCSSLRTNRRLLHLTRSRSLSRRAAERRPNSHAGHLEERRALSFFSFFSFFILIGGGGGRAAVIALPSLLESLSRSAHTLLARARPVPIAAMALYYDLLRSTPTPPDSSVSRSGMTHLYPCGVRPPVLRLVPIGRSLMSKAPGPGSKMFGLSGPRTREPGYKTPRTAATRPLGRTPCGVFCAYLLTSCRTL